MLHGVSRGSTVKGYCKRFADEYHPFFSGQRVTRHLFERDMHEAMNNQTAQTPHYSPLLHNAILSVALCYADEEHLRFPGTRKIFAQQAKRFIDNDCANPTVATVQGLVTLSSYHSLEGEYNLGWIYVGQGSRVAQACKSCVFRSISVHLLTFSIHMSVGLHLDPSELVSTGKLSAAEATEVS